MCLYTKAPIIFQLVHTHRTNKMSPINKQPAAPAPSKNPRIATTLNSLSCARILKEIAAAIMPIMTHAHHARSDGFIESASDLIAPLRFGYPFGMELASASTNLLPLANVTSISVEESKQNCAPSRGKEIVSHSSSFQKFIATLKGWPDVVSIAAGKRPSSRMRPPSGKCAPCWEKNNLVLRFLHSVNTFSNLSSDDFMFIHLIRYNGPNRAISLATKFHLQCQRPLRALLAMMNERDRSYTKRNAKRKRRVNSRSSSKKRSSTS